jgi:pimeloyl-ACP methyl ester carboxylesterase
MFSILQPRIEQMLVWLYPSNPSVVKTGLAGGILRDSQDPGASDVIAAGGKLPTPRPMNDIFREYTGPVLIAQGALDPLNDAKSRANIFKGIREGVTLDLLPLGHCPMDENPKMVRNMLCNAMLSYADIDTDTDTSITLFYTFSVWAYDVLLHPIIL